MAMFSTSGFQLRGLLTRVIINNTATKEMRIEKPYTEVLCNAEFDKFKKRFLKAILWQNQLKRSPFPELYFLTASFTSTLSFSKSKSSSTHYKWFCPALIATKHELIQKIEFTSNSAASSNGSENFINGLKLSSPLINRTVLCEAAVLRLVVEHRPRNGTL
jgi:hypothetical protein